MRFYACITAEQQGNLSAHALVESARETKTKMAAIFLECSLLFPFLVLRLVCLTRIESKHKPIVCHKYCVKKLETTRNILQGCFDVLYDYLFCLAQRYILLQHDKKYIFSRIHNNIFIVKQLKKIILKTYT